MRGSLKVLATVLAAIALVGTGPVSGGSANLTPAQKNDLGARRAALVVQLQALLLTQRGDSASLGAAEQQYIGAQESVTQARDLLNATNAKLVQLQQQITQDTSSITDAKRELAQLTRQLYENSSNDGVMTAVLNSQSFGDAVSQLQAAQSTDSKLIDLQDRLKAQDQQLRQEQSDLQQKVATAATQETTLAASSNAFLVAVANRNAALATASGPVRALEAQIADIDNQLAADQAPAQSSSAPPVNGGSCGNHFAYGQCTWYVASRRCIPWTGNAKDWFYAAARMGYAEGHSPAPGAVVVFWPGGDGASSVGHVGYVEVVGPAGGVPAGSFKLSEMNFGGWGRVNYRVLPNNSSGIQGFIYGHA